MTIAFGALLRTTALSVTITLLASPVAAQTQVAAPATDAPSGPLLLSETTFARFAQTARLDAARPKVEAHAPRPTLLRQGTAAMARQVQAAPAKAPQQKSWVARHKAATAILIAGGAFAATMLGLWAAYPD